MTSDKLTTQTESDSPAMGEALDFHPLRVPRERLDLRLLSALRQITRAVGLYSKRLVVDHGVTVPQLMCLMKIDELGSLTIKELAREMFLNASTVVGIADRLEKHELLKRVRSVRDRRKVRLHLTEKGIRLLERAPSPLHEKLADSLEELPELERLTIAASLDKIISLLADDSHEGVKCRELPEEPILDAGSDLRQLEHGND